MRPSLFIDHSYRPPTRRRIARVPTDLSEISIAIARHPPCRTPPMSIRITLSFVIAPALAVLVLDSRMTLVAQQAVVTGDAPPYVALPRPDQAVEAATVFPPIGRQLDVPPLLSLPAKAPAAARGRPRERRSAVPGARSRAGLESATYNRRIERRCNRSGAACRQRRRDVANDDRTGRLEWTH